MLLAQNPRETRELLEFTGSEELSSWTGHALPEVWAADDEDEAGDDFDDDDFDDEFDDDFDEELDEEDDLDDDMSDDVDELGEDDPDAEPDLDSDEDEEAGADDFEARQRDLGPPHPAGPVRRPR